MVELVALPPSPPTLRVFSNCDVMRVIMPMAAMNDSRLSTWRPGQHAAHAGFSELRTRTHSTVFHGQDGPYCAHTKPPPRTPLPSSTLHPASPDLRDSLALHAETADDPVAAAERRLQAVGDGVGADGLGHVKLRGKGSSRVRVR